MSILRSLWLGQFSLRVSFWVFYVLGYLISVGLTSLISPLFHTQPWRLLSVLVLIIPYNIASTVGVLRSANSYTSAKGWSFLTQIIVCLWEARIVWSVVAGTLRAAPEF